MHVEIGPTLLGKYAALFGGVHDELRPDAFGTGKGQWIKRRLTYQDFYEHLHGIGPGIGLPPLRKDSTCWFAAIDLDEPDFEAALEMQSYLPGTSFIERSRSGNAHCWVFFSEPIEAWVPMGILKEATLAAGKSGVEVFPKNHDFTKVRLGSYINLPYHGKDRYVLYPPAPGVVWPIASDAKDIHDFVKEAAASLNDPADWRKRAQWLMIQPPGERKESKEFGSQPYLHQCAEYIIANCEDNPIRAGHRSVVYFSLAKMLTNWEMCDHDEAVELLRQVNEASPDRITDYELRRILGNAERGQYTSFGCDDPLMAPYVDPKCPIASGG